MDRPGSGERIAEIGGFALILIMFLFAWFGVKDAPEEINGFDAFDAFSDWVGIILTFTAFAGISLGMFGAAAGRDRLPVAPTALAAGLGIVSVILIIIFLISPPSIDFGGQESADLERKLGAFLGLISAAAVAFGGWSAMQAEGTSFGAQADRVQDRFEGGGPEPPSTPPPPPPPPPPTTGAP
jgi:hypothetical protein